jgi:hypothetical protein
MLTVLGGLAELERELIRARTGLNWGSYASSAQYGSLKQPDGFFDVDRRQLFVCSSSKREVAHLAFDSARIASVA